MTKYEIFSIKFYERGLTQKAYANREGVSPSMLSYYHNHWPKLIALTEDGSLELHNNLIENKIRPLALGRKNYLFAGSHKAVQRIALMYSFFASCKANGVNPYDWMKETLEKLPETKLSELDTLIPGYQMKGVFCPEGYDCAAFFFFPKSN